MPSVERPIIAGGPTVRLFQRLNPFHGGRDHGSVRQDGDRYHPTPRRRPHSRTEYPKLLRPMPGVITQGVRPGHPAIDIACTVGTPVRAAHDGQGSAHSSHTHGNVFVLRGANGLETSYAHLSATRPGGNYKRGDQIGNCGNTGAWTTGPHLHFESNHPELFGSLADS